MVCVCAFFSSFISKECWFLSVISVSIPLFTLFIEHNDGEFDELPNLGSKVRARRKIHLTLVTSHITFYSSLVKSFHWIWSILPVNMTLICRFLLNLNRALYSKSLSPFKHTHKRVISLICLPVEWHIQAAHRYVDYADRSDTSLALLIAAERKKIKKGLHENLIRIAMVSNIRMGDRPI